MQTSYPHDDDEPYDDPEPDRPYFSTPQLTRTQYDQLELQLSQTPAPDAGSSENNAHAQLEAVLVKLGHSPGSRWEVYHLALALVDAGWKEESRTV